MTDEEMLKKIKQQRAEEDALDLRAGALLSRPAGSFTKEDKEVLRGAILRCIAREEGN